MSRANPRSTSSLPELQVEQGILQVMAKAFENGDGHFGLWRQVAGQISQDCSSADKILQGRTQQAIRPTFIGRAHRDAGAALTRASRHSAAVAQAGGEDGRRGCAHQQTAAIR